MYDMATRYTNVEKGDGYRSIMRINFILDNEKSEFVEPGCHVHIGLRGLPYLSIKRVVQDKENFPHICDKAKDIAYREHEINCLKKLHELINSSFAEFDLYANETSFEPHKQMECCQKVILDTLDSHWSQ